MKAVILAAGRGNSFEIITENKPKCLLDFGSETIIQRQIRLLKEYGLQNKDIIIVTGYMSECICIDDEIIKIYNPEYNTTDNSYSLQLALRYCDEDTLVLDGDLVFDKSVLLTVIEGKGNILAGLNEQTAYGMTGITYTGKEVTAIGKHIVSDITYASIMRISRSSINPIVVELEKKGNKKTWYTVPLNSLMGSVRFRVKAVSGKVLGINTYFDYVEAKKAFCIEDYTVLVTGASGFLGKKIYYILKRYYKVAGIRRKRDNDVFATIDICSKSSVSAYLELTRPSVIVHTAGIPEPEVCEKDKENAWKNNVEAVRIIADLCRERNIKLIYISTDYVFDGDDSEEYRYDSVRNPKNYYGETKLAGENIVINCPNSLIVRIPVIYGYNDETDKETFPIKVIRSLIAGKTMILDNKQIRYPVLIDEVAFAIKDAMHKTGIIHITSSHPVTKYTWGKIIAEEFDLESKLIQEDKNSSLDDRPPHVKLKVMDNDYELSETKKGTSILKKQLRCFFKLIYKSNPTENIYGLNIGEYRYQLGKSIGRSIPEDVVEDIDCVMPIPNSGLYYAMGLADAIKKPYLQALVKPDSYVRSFQIADVALREQTIRDKILPIPELILDKKIALVDEAIFTGTTFRVVCDIIKACGAKKIYICIAAPICRNCCKQYVQPERKPLSHEINVNNADYYFKVDGVYFQPYQNLMESLADVKDICFECFDMDLV